MSECLVLDCGSFSVKAGLSTDEVPQTIRSLVGQSRRDPNGAIFAGDAVLGLGNGSARTEPISEGQIDDFDSFELLLDFVYKSTGAGEGVPVVLAEPVFNSEANREKLTELFFEKYQTPSLSMTLQGILALVGTGRVTGLVLDCGHSGCQTVPIFESFVIPHSMGSMRIGGGDLDTLLAKLLAIHGVARLAKTSDREVVRQIKESKCFCRKSVEITECESAEFKLPDGKNISLNRERFVVPEALFKPSMIGAEGEGVAALVGDSIKSAPIDLTKPLVSNIIVSGGSSMFEGFASRLQTEVKYKMAANISRDVKVVASTDRKTSVWNGGKAFAELRESFEERWMTRNEYEEFGAGFIQNKVMTINK